MQSTSTSICQTTILSLAVAMGEDYCDDGSYYRSEKRHCTGLGRIPNEHNGDPYFALLEPVQWNSVEPWNFSLTISNPWTTQEQAWSELDPYQYNTVIPTTTPITCPRHGLSQIGPAFATTDIDFFAEDLTQTTPDSHGLRSCECTSGSEALLEDAAPS